MQAAAVILTYILFVLQTALAPRLAIGCATIDLVLVSLTWIVRWSGRGQGLWLAAAWGLLADAVGDELLGIQMVCYTLAAWGLHVLSSRREGRGAWSIWLVAFSVCSTCRAAIDLVPCGLAGASFNGPDMLKTSAACGLYTSIVATLPFLAARAIWPRGQSAGPRGLAPGRLPPPLS